MEQLEQRLLLASDWQNPSRPLDVNNDGQATPSDALRVINELARRDDPIALGARSNRLASFYDTSGDGTISPIDALNIINGLARSGDGPVYDYSSAEGEGDIAPAGFTSMMLAELPGSDGQRVDITTRFEFIGEQFNELGYFVADSDAGDVNGMVPSHPDYPDAVFQSSHRQVVYSKFGSGPTEWMRTLPAGSYVGLYVLQPTDDNGHPENHLSLKTNALDASDANASDVDQSLQVGWEMFAGSFLGPSVGNRGFDDVLIDVDFGDPYSTGGSPVLESIVDQHTDENVLFQYSVVASDSDLPNDSLTYSIDSGPVGLVIDPSSGQIMWTPSESAGPGTYSVTIRVTDNDQNFDVESFDVSVAEVNQRPTLSPIINLQIVELSELAIALAATDLDVPANTLSYSVVAGPAEASVDPVTGAFRWTPTEADGPGDHVFTVRVSDSDLFDEQSFTVVVTEENLSPILGSIDDVSVRVGETVQFTASATDPDLPANSLTFRLAAGAPAGASIDAQTGEFTWTPGATDSRQNHNVTVVVEDNGVPSRTAMRSFTVSVVNSAPTLNEVADAQVSELAMLTIDLAASDVDLPNDQLIYSLQSGPANAGLDSSAGRLTWTPTEQQGPGSFSFVVAVEDLDGATDSKSFTVTVAEVNQAPVIAQVLEQNVTEEDLLSLTIGASDDDDPANQLVFALTDGPAGAQVDSESGVFSWTPTEADGPGTYSVTVTVTDDGTPTLSDDVTFDIVVGEENQSPVLNPIGDKSVDEGSALTFTASATDPDTPVNDLRFSITGAPVGASIDPTSGVFNWTPTETEAPMNYMVTVIVTDNGNPELSDQEIIMLSAREVNKPPVLDPIANASIEFGETVSFTASAVDPDQPANNITYSLDAGAPAGAMINSSTGQFTWTPAQSDSDGTFPITVIATDDGVPMMSDTESFTVTVGSCPFSDDLAGWTASESGGNETPGGVTDDGCAAVLTEGDSFLVTLETTFIVPDDATELSFTYSDLNFDTTDLDFINDAFEVALLDQDGNPLVDSYSDDHDAFFNLTENLPIATSRVVTVDDVTGSGNQVTVDLTGVLAGETATLVFRLANNDDDTTTEVTITDYYIPGFSIDSISTDGFVAASTPTASVASVSSQDSDLALMEAASMTSFDASPASTTVTSEPVVIESTFDDDLEGWEVGLAVDDLQQKPNGGVPGGYLRGTDGPRNSYVIAPEKFLGDLTSFNHGMVSFDHIAFTAIHPPEEVTGQGRVTFVGNGNTGSVYASVPSNLSELDTWTNRSLDLSAENWISENTGLPATESEFLAVLSDVTELRVTIDTDYDNVPAEIAGMDNFRIVAPTPQNGILISASAPESVLAGSQIVIDGTAEDALSDNAIVLVTINGTPVDVLDPAGRFFTSVELQPGVNKFEITAEDESGNTASTTVSTTGTQLQPGQIDFRQFADITGSFSGVYGRTSFNEDQHRLLVDLATRNDGIFESDVPLLVGVQNVSDSSVRVVDADGQLPDGTPYFDFSTQVADGTLSPGESTDSPTIAFSNPQRNQFDYELVFLGKLNQAPEITTVPKIDAPFDRQYTYDVDAIDRDGDSLTYSLEIKPDAMVGPDADGVITWSPTAEDVGLHDVSVLVTDGRGGSAVQRFTIQVNEAPPNRPPVFTSYPVTGTSVAEDLQNSQNQFVLNSQTTTVVRFPRGTQGAPNWTFTSDGLEARQNLNAEPSALLLNDTIFANQKVSGSIKVQQDSDNDFIGFVFGYQDLNHFYLFSWKQSTQTDFGDRGMTVKVIESDGPFDYAGLTRTGSFDGITELYRNNIGWADKTGYEFELDFQDGFFTITVMDGPTLLDSFTIADDTYTSGQFGFYNYSQANVRYRGYTAESLATPTYDYGSTAFDADGDELSFRLISNPDGMVVNPKTGQLLWAPTAEQVGNHDVSLEVSDGNGGIAIQDFVVCVHDPNANDSVVETYDLAVRDIDTSGLSYDGQLLTVSGTISATVVNRGADDIFQPYEVTFFEDTDGNEAFSPDADTILGTEWVTEPIAGNSTRIITSELSGEVLFSENVVWAFIDSGDVVTEIDELNNLARKECEFIPEVGLFDPAWEWDWTSTSVEPNSRNVMMTPAVMDLTGDGIAEIIFGTSTVTNGTSVPTGVLRAISGDGGAELFTVTDSAHRIDASVSVAVGDIDGDGLPEILAGAESRTAVIAFEHDGTFKWRSPTIQSFSYGSIALADLDADGSPEIVVGRQVLNSDGTIRWTGEGSRGSAHVANIDASGLPEVVSGSAVYDWEGNLLWEAAGPTGFNAIGDFDDDPFAEIVLVSRKTASSTYDGKVRLFEHDGTLIWESEIPGRGKGGPPTVADFDGDGLPEIGVAGATRYTVFDTDGSQLWSKTIQDTSSNTTGSSVFDFDGDGSAEVVYSDETKLHVFAGADGARLWSTSLSSCTWTEYPVIADVDSDGNAEIVAVANNNCNKGPQRGIYVYGSASDSWVGTREIWNQHGYHVTNINDDGTIPVVEENSWQLNNSYRQNEFLGETSARVAPDLTASYVRFQEDSENLRVTARVGNGGAQFAQSGLPISLYDGDPQAGGTSLSTVFTDGDLQPADFVDVEFIVPSSSLNDLWISVDDDGTGKGIISECSETNNFYHPGLDLSGANEAPIFESSPVVSAAEGQLYSYAPVATDPNGDSLTFDLRVSPEAMTVEQDTGKLTWTPNAADSGRHSVQLVVSDSAGGRTAQLFFIDVAERINQRPSLSDLPPTTTIAGEVYDYAVVGTDPENDLLTYELLQSPDRMRIGADSGRITWIPQHSDVGAHQVLVQVTDQAGATDSLAFELVVAAANNPPLIVSSPVASATVGQTWQYRLRAQDADGDMIGFRLDDAPIDMSIESTELRNSLGVLVETYSTVNWTVPESAFGTDPSVTIVAEDGRGSESHQTFTLDILGASATNTAPQIHSTPRPTAITGREWTYLVDATDANGDALSYSLLQSPAGMNVDSTGLLTWDSPVSTPGSVPVEVLVDDGRGGQTTQAFDLVIVSVQQNSIPAITSVPPTQSVVNQLYAYDPIATDPDGDELIWSLTVAPRGMSIDAMSGSIRWIPDDQQLGTHIVAVTSTDPFLGEFTQRYEIHVGCNNLTPTIVSVPPTLAVTDRTYLYAVRANDLENDPLSWSLASAPDGMSIDPESGVIRWAPTIQQVDSHDIVVAVGDGINTSTQSYTVVVNDADDPTAGGVNRAPVITSSPRFNAEADAVYQYAVTAIDPDGDTMTYSLSGTVPDGMDVDANGLITWTPSAGDAGDHPVIVAVTDEFGATSTQGFSISVTVNRPPEITSNPVETATRGATYRYTVRATDLDGDPLTYAVVDGPEGMTIDQFGRILWQTSVNDVEPQAVSVSVSDDRGQSATQQWDIVVGADVQPPSVGMDVYVGTTSFIGDGQIDVGSTYRVVVSATDNVGVANVTLFVDDQAVAIDGRGSVTLSADQLGTISLRAVATDVNGLLGTSESTITVIDPAVANQPDPNNPTLPPNPGPVSGDRNGPLVGISSPDAGESVTNQVSIIGTVDDAENNLWYYRVMYSRTDRVSLTNIDLKDPDWVVIAQSTEEVIDGELAVFDTAGLANDAYTIALVGFDFNGRGFLDATMVNVEGNVLVGNFQLSLTDLSIPLAGIPIQVTRSYDTLNAPDESDFGYGWQLGTQDPRIFEVAAIAAGGALNGGDGKLIPDRSKVYLTNPDGQRVGFTYREELKTVSVFGAIYRPYFEPDPGVYDTLTIDETKVGRGGLVGALAAGINPSKYTLTTKDGLKYRYDQVEGLQTITDLNGNVVTFSEDGIQHSNGQSIDFIRDHRDRITQVIDPAGNSIDYTYDLAGDLVTATNQIGLETHYTYREDPKHFLDEAYDSLGKRVLKAVYEQNPETRQYDFKGVIDAAGIRVDQRDFDTATNTGIVRDGNGNATTIIYDDRGNVLTEIDPLGNVTVREYNDPRNPDAETRIIDRRGFITEQEFDSRGNLLKIIERGSDGEPIEPPNVTEFTYDSRSRVTSITNALGAVTELEYDRKGNLIQITNALGDSSSFTYDSQGRRRTATDFNGNTTTFDYIDACPCGSPSKATYADGTYQTYAYNQFGQVTRESTFEADGTMVEIRETDYDDVGRVTEERSGIAGDPDHPQTIVRNVYDGHLLDWEIIVNPASPNETPATPVDERLSRITEYEYDENDRLVRQIDALGGVVEFRYDAAGNRTLLQDPVGNITTWVYDELNRVAEERDPFYNENLTIDQAVALLDTPSGADLSVDQGADHVRAFAYDAEGNQIEMIDRNGRRREFEYDDSGRLLTETWFSADTNESVETIQFSYDAVGNMLTASNANSRYRHTYDELNRLTSVDNNPLGDRDVPRVILTYGYDAQGNTILTQDDSGVTYDSEYDARNRLTVRKWYDADVPTGEDPDVDDTRVDFFYNAAGREAEMRRYNGLDTSSLVGRTERTFDAIGQSDSLTHVNALDELIAGYDYDYDFSGLLIHETRTHQDTQYAQTVDYTYDLSGQLTDAIFSGQDNEHFTYDANGNRKRSQLGSEVKTYVTGSANQIESDGEYWYEYDGEGNQVKRSKIDYTHVQQFTYDHRNQLVLVREWRSNQEDPGSTFQVPPDKTLEYSIDSLGRRIESKEIELGSIEVSYRHYNRSDVWSDEAAPTHTKSRYLLSSGSDRIVSVVTLGIPRWYLADRTNTVRQKVDKDHASLYQLHYSSYGIPKKENDSGELESTHLFQGRDASSTTELYDFRSRAYDPKSGRFMQRDRIGFLGQDVNLYRSFANSPVNFSDPTGTSIASFAIEVGKISGALAVGGVLGFGISYELYDEVHSRIQAEAHQAARVHGLSCRQEDMLRHFVAGYSAGWAGGPVLGFGYLNSIWLELNPADVNNTWTGFYFGVTATAFQPVEDGLRVLRFLDPTDANPSSQDGYDGYWHC